MYAQPTTTVTVRRGTTTDGFADVVDTGTPIRTGLPMSILQQRRASTGPAESRVQQVAWFTGRTHADADVQPGDQLIDERSGVAYRVDDAAVAPSTVAPADLVVQLRRVA